MLVMCNLNKCDFRVRLNPRMRTVGDRRGEMQLLPTNIQKEEN